jgi:hypothetical protein
MALIARRVLAGAALVLLLAVCVQPVLGSVEGPAQLGPIVPVDQVRYVEAYGSGCPVVRTNASDFAVFDNTVSSGGSASQRSEIQPGRISGTLYAWGYRGAMGSGYEVGGSSYLAVEFDLIRCVTYNVSSQMTSGTGQPASTWFGLLGPAGYIGMGALTQSGRLEPGHYRLSSTVQAVPGLPYYDVSGTCTFSLDVFTIGDINHDGGVDVVDLLYFVDAFGSVSGDANYDPTCDFNSDSSVDVTDLLELVESFGM